MPKPTIMIVEDELPLLDNLTLYFTEHHYRVISAGTVDDAVAILATENPDIILLDLLLPKRLGTELLSTLKSQGRNIPVIVITNTDAIGRREECFGLGARDFIIKSNTSLSHLQKLVDQYIEVTKASNEKHTR